MKIVKRYPSILICLLAGCLYWTLVWPCAIVPLSGGYDSLLYLRMAEYMVQGLWLGPYDHMTLIRPPLYPAFIALNKLTEIPLHVTQHLLYFLSITLLAAAFIENNISPLKTTLFFVMGLMHPVAQIAAGCIVTEAIYTSLTTAVAAGLFGMVGSLTKSTRRFYLWGGQLIFSVPLFYYCRSESVWILPFLLFGGCVAIWKSVVPLNTHRLFKLSILTLLAVSALLGTGAWIASKNLTAYGIRTISELSEPNFKTAFNRLSRIDSGTRISHVPVPRSSMKAAAEASPHFELIYPILEKQTHGAGWSGPSCSWMGICDEIAGGWWVWAVRDAVAQIGMYADAQKADEFYLAIADELDRAADNAPAAPPFYTPNPTGNYLSPPLTVGDIPGILSSIWKITQMTLTFDDLPTQLKHARFDDIPEDLIDRYDTITHSRWPGWSNFSGPFSPWLSMAYRFFQLGGILYFIYVLIFRNKQRHPMIIAGMMILIISRILLIAYIDAMSFYAQLRYVIAIYPVLTGMLIIAAPSFNVKWKMKKGERSIFCQKK